MFLQRNQRTWLRNKHVLSGRGPSLYYVSSYEYTSSASSVAVIVAIMSPQDPASPTAGVSVGDMAAMSDSALRAFMAEHRRPNGVIDLPVDGWDKLSTEGRDRLRERLL